MFSSFWFGSKIENFLFVDLNIYNYWGLGLLCLILSGIAIAFEGFKVLHADAKIRTVLYCSQGKPKRTNSQDGSSLLGEFPQNSKRKRALCYLMEVSLYLVQVILGYLLMLSVMSYNGYISLSILFGVAMGYALFGQVLLERRVKSTQLAMPCHHCLQSEGSNNITSEPENFQEEGIQELVE